MTPVQFERMYAPQWQQLDELLRQMDDGKAAGRIDGARLSALYRSACEQLSLAQSRAYPVHMRQRLETLVAQAHQAIYRRQDYGVARLKQLVLVDFPQSVRLHRIYVLISTVLILLPALVLGFVTYWDPGFLLHFMDYRDIVRFESMYDGSSEAFGRDRTADDDMTMFGFYIMNNIGVGFRCFAGGLFGGLGSIFFLVFNGLHMGGVAGYLVARGHGGNFFQFVVTHSAFELTAIVLAGAAGLRMGHALLAPGELSRGSALQRAASQAVVLVYGVVGMLIIAAALEAFWSSSRWVGPGVKYAVASVCWLFVLAYLIWQGRPAAPVAKGHDAR